MCFGMATNHDTLRQVCFCNDDGTQVLEDLNEDRIFLRGTKRPSDIPQRGINALQIELIFEGDRDSMERTFGPLGSFEMGI